MFCVGVQLRSFTHHPPLPQIVQKTVAYYSDIESLVVGQVRALELLHLNSRRVGGSMLTEKWSEVNFPHDNEYFTDPDSAGFELKGRSHLRFEAHWKVYLLGFGCAS